MTVRVLINKFSCAKEVYKIAIKRWRIGALETLERSPVFPSTNAAGGTCSHDDVTLTVGFPHARRLLVQLTVTPRSIMVGPTLGLVQLSAVAPHI